MWVDKTDDRFWRERTRVEICTTNRDGSCSGDVSYRVSRVEYDWLPRLTDSNYKIIATRDRREIGETILTSLTRRQVCGDQPVSTGIVTR
jgi:hypothetical protein